MQMGMIGLGRMGANMVRRLMQGNHTCVVFDLNADNVKRLRGEGAAGTTSLDDFASKLDKPRVAWVMVPAGGPTENTVLALAEHFEAGDIIIDGGNTYFKDDVRRGKLLKEKGIHYVDVGTSGGVWGLERGYCMMVGGAKEAVRHIDPILKTLAPGRGDIPRTPGREQKGGTAEEGYVHCGPMGAGHFVKMVHNGIEYGLMQAYAEGFDIFRNANSESLPADIRYDLDMTDIAEVWRRGSVISSWLLDLTAMALLENPDLSNYSGFVQDSGEGRWTIMTAIEEAVPADVLSAALYTRFRSRQEHTFAEKILSAMRHKFGGHVESPPGG
ncbi:MAG: decarboxylating 6-phosphogluconate dehydrogenase [Proteobacteria bacterium]|nr:MAG: decarboxylating 6-phosphogluconate dehydrogenase [Pseudomonadota bacterium]TDJ70222.1 MAG: decarboxylating 6-phosphogluconate dehydrogenase [Pseudomonadota bacterium]